MCAVSLAAGSCSAAVRATDTGTDSPECGLVAALSNAERVQRPRTAEGRANSELCRADAGKSNGFGGSTVRAKIGSGETSSAVEMYVKRKEQERGGVRVTW